MVSHDNRGGQRGGDIPLWGKKTHKYHTLVTSFVGTRAGTGLSQKINDSGENRTHLLGGQGSPYYSNGGGLEEFDFAKMRKDLDEREKVWVKTSRQNFINLHLHRRIECSDAYRAETQGSKKGSWKSTKSPGSPLGGECTWCTSSATVTRDEYEFTIGIL